MKLARGFVAVILCIGLLASAPSCAWGQFPAASRPASTSQRPKLIVVVVIDQFRADYLHRFRERFGPGGFNRLLREGAYFSECYFPYAITETGPGHATLATGTTPDRHGIAGNDWYDFHRKKLVEAAEDDSTRIVGGIADRVGASPRNLIGTTLAAELRLATAGQSKVYGVSLKDRSAMFSTGPGASGAFWYESSSGRFVSSTYYYKEALPGWATAFNQRSPVDRYYGKDWTVSGRVALSMSTSEGKPNRDFYRNFPFTPYGNELVIEFAREVLDKESLGADAITDFLFVGLSSNDYVGHRWGPYSDEVADITLQTDKQLAAFLAHLDLKIGKGNYWFVFSGDHGVAPTLAQSRSMGLDAKNLEFKSALGAVSAALTSRWGPGDWFVAAAPGTLNRETLAKYNVTVEQAARAAGEAAMSVEGILGYVTAHSELTSPSIARAYRLSWFPGRTPDLLLVQQPFSLWNGDRGGTTHGTPYTYDTHVPLLFYGSAFRAHHSAMQVATMDLAPTLASALAISPPSLSTGRVLTDALRTPQAAFPAATKKP